MNEVLNLTEYAAKIGAELKPTVLADMPIKEITPSKGDYFGGLGDVVTWLEVVDHSGGVNNSGLWPFSVQKLDSGKLVIVGSSC